MRREDSRAPHLPVAIVSAYARWAERCYKPDTHTRKPPSLPPCPGRQRPDAAVAPENNSRPPSRLARRARPPKRSMPARPITQRNRSISSRLLDVYAARILTPAAGRIRHSRVGAAAYVLPAGRPVHNTLHWPTNFRVSDSLYLQAAGVVRSRIWL